MALCHVCNHLVAHLLIYCVWQQDCFYSEWRYQHHTGPRPTVCSHMKIDYLSIQPSIKVSEVKYLHPWCINSTFLFHTDAMAHHALLATLEVWLHFYTLIRSSISRWSSIDRIGIEMGVLVRFLWGDFNRSPHPFYVIEVIQEFVFLARKLTISLINPSTF